MSNASTRERWILTATILASGMAFLDSSIVNLALPALQRDFGANFVDIQWVINAYALSSASLLLLGGALGDRFGQRKMFSGGILLFMLASLGASLAHSIDQLIFWRSIQGVGAAIMIPGSLAIINVSFPESTRGRIIGLWAGASGGMAAFGSFLGGVLIEKFDWPSVFYINVPLGLLALWGTLQAVRDHEHEKRSLDIAGTVFITLGLLGLAYGLMQGPVTGWNHWYISGSIVGGIVSILAFIVVEMRSKIPMVPLEIFRNKNVLGSNLVTFFLYGALAAVFLLLALNLQQVQGLSPTIAALGLLPFPIIIMLFAGKGGEIADRVGPRVPMVVGPLLVAAGMVLLALPQVGVPVWYFLPGVTLCALGMCLHVAPQTKAALSVEPKLSGAASGVNNAVSRVAGLLAIAVFGGIMVGLFSTHLRVELDNTDLEQSQKQEIQLQSAKLGGVVVPITWTEHEQEHASESVEKAFVYGYSRLIYLNAALALLSALIAFLTIRNRKSS